KVLAQLPVLVLELEHVIAEVAQFYRRLFGVAKIGDGSFGGTPFGTFLGAACKRLEDGDSLGIIELTQRVDGGELDAFFGMVDVTDEKFTHAIFFILMTC